MSADVHIPESDASLLAQCDVETFRAGGPGGQHQNVTDSAVRLRHRPTGLVVTCRAQRSQYLNKMDAVRRLRIKLRKLSEQPAARVPTVPSEAAVVRRVSAKKARGAAKRLRRAPSSEDE